MFYINFWLIHICFCLVRDTFIIGLCDGITISYDCESEQAAYEAYITYSRSYSSTPITDNSAVNESVLTSLFDLNNTIGFALSEDNLLYLNGFHTNHSFISFGFDTETLTEDSYYLFRVTMYITTTTADYNFSDDIGLYVKPTAVISNTHLPLQ